MCVLDVQPLRLDGSAASIVIYLRSMLVLDFGEPAPRIAILGLGECAASQLLTVACANGAGDRSRTDDIQLGKLTLFVCTGVARWVFC